MRKDLKIGLAIGAVLLVVLIVYAAVPKGGDDTIAQSGGGAGDTPTSDTNSAAVTAETSTSTPAPADTQRAAANAREESTTPAKPDEHAATPKPDPFDNAGKTGAKESTETASNNNAAGGDVWATVLEKGELPVHTVTPVSLSASKFEKPEAGKTSTETKAIEPKAKLGAESTPISTDTVTGGETSKKSEAIDSTSVAGAAPRTHKVAKGEDYSKIAKMVYGDSKYYLKIEEANPNLDATKLKPGTVINLPDLAAVKGKSSSDTSAAVTASDKKIGDNEYRVVSNDSLYKIAMKKYGSSSMADAIYEANKSTIGDDPAKLKIDMVLKLPPNPAR